MGNYNFVHDKEDAKGYVRQETGGNLPDRSGGRHILGHYELEQVIGDTESVVESDWILLRQSEMNELTTRSSASSNDFIP